MSKKQVGVLATMNTHFLKTLVQLVMLHRNCEVVRPKHFPINDTLSHLKSQLTYPRILWAKQRVTIFEAKYNSQQFSVILGHRS